MAARFVVGDALVGKDFALVESNQTSQRNLFLH